MIAIFPELVTLARAADIEKLAVMARRYYGGEETFFPRIDLERMLQNVGIRVERLVNGSQGSLLAKDEQGRFMIVALLDPQLESVAARFLLAHQMGHYLLDIQPLIARGDWQVSGYRESICPSRRYASREVSPSRQAIDARREARADAFAAALLMPIGMLRKAYERLKDRERLATFFGVAPAVLAQRLDQVGLTRSPLPQNFLDAEARLEGGGLRHLSANAETVEQLVQATPSPPPPSMPRSFAAATYGQTDKRTRGLVSGEATADKHATLALPSQTVHAPGQTMDLTQPTAKLDSEVPAHAQQASKPHHAPVPGAGFQTGSFELTDRAKSSHDAMGAAERSAQGMARIRELAQRLENERLKRLNERSVG